MRTSITTILIAAIFTTSALAASIPSLGGLFDQVIGNQKVLNLVDPDGRVQPHPLNHPYELQDLVPARTVSSSTQHRTSAQSSSTHTGGANHAHAMPAAMVAGPLAAALLML